MIIRKPGISTTIQDLGRTGARRFAINPGGAMDRTAARVANIILENDDSAAVIESHFPSIEIEFDADTTYAVTGADFDARIDDVPIRNWSAATARKGSVLGFKKKIWGTRVYVAVHGGVQADDWLGSSSTNILAGRGGLSGRRLVKGDRIECGNHGESFPFAIGNSITTRYSDRPTVRVLAGNEFELLTAMAERTFQQDTFTLTNDCDRMGYRLSGPSMNLLHDREMVTSAVCFGTIQLLPDGQLIVLMADHQTSGGYPRIATVVSTDLPLLAQCGPGDKIRFEIISVGEAERLAFQFEKELNFLRVGCRLLNEC